MSLFTRVAKFRTPTIKLASGLRTFDSSLKFLRTLSFSSPKLSGNLKHSHNAIPSPRVCVFPLTRKHLHLLSSIGPSQTDGGVFLHRGKQFTCLVKFFHTNQTNTAKIGTDIKGSPAQNKSALIYVVAIFILMLGGAYAGVPLYKVFCQTTGLGGQAVNKAHETEKIESMKKVDRQIRVRFNADVASSMRWNFKPQQTEVTVLPGETALAFYTAKNPTDKPIIGISTYNVLPFDAGQYFNKIQCFCFEEQRLNPKEQVDMPVFFYIDPEFAEDPKLEHVDTIHLSYTFFEAVDGLTLPLPGYPQPHDPLPSA